MFLSAIFILVGLVDLSLELRVHQLDALEGGQRAVLLDRDGVRGLSNSLLRPENTETSAKANLSTSRANAASKNESREKFIEKTTQTETLLGRRYKSPYSVEELLNLVIPNKTSMDVDMDPCKAGIFIGDIVFPLNGSKPKEAEMFDVRDTMSEPRVGRAGPTSDLQGFRDTKTETYWRKGKGKSWGEKEVWIHGSKYRKLDKSSRADKKLKDWRAGVGGEGGEKEGGGGGGGEGENGGGGEGEREEGGGEGGSGEEKLFYKQFFAVQRPQPEETQHTEEHSVQQLSHSLFSVQQPSFSLPSVQQPSLPSFPAYPSILSPPTRNVNFSAIKINPALTPPTQSSPPTHSSQPARPLPRPYTPGSSARQYASNSIGTKLDPEDEQLLLQHSPNLQDQHSQFNYSGYRQRQRQRHRRYKIRNSRRLLLKERREKHRSTPPPSFTDKRRNKIQEHKREKKDRLQEDKEQFIGENENIGETKEKKTRKPGWKNQGEQLDQPGWKVEDRPGRWAGEAGEDGEGGMLTAAASRPRRKRAATARPERIWDFAVIPYEIDANFSGVHKALFKQAMRHWENYTCIQFVERTQEHPNWIVFTERPCGCCSFVGKRGNGPQAISIGKNCDKFGIVVHELGHVVGFWHEHTRPDRDNWVTIIRENVILGQDYNFNKLTSEEVNSQGLRYDYDSIMHYARNTFSKGTYLDTILPRSDLPENQESLPEIGQRIRLSKGDIVQTSSLYNCPACGKTYQDTAGKFGSPQYSFYMPPPGRETQPFRKGDLCQWRILATHGEKIILNITALDIPSSPNCQLDYLEVRDGYWHKSHLLARLCGTVAPEPIISSGSRLMLTYKTHESSQDHMGFLAQYEAVCGGELDTESGQLESPNFPEDYQPSKECIWKIRVAEEFQVALKFQSFEIENHDNCVYDYLEIRDGETSSSPLIGTYCGYKMPKDIKSSTNSLWIKFVSDGSVQKAGFSASFMKEYDECQSPDHGCEHECTNTLGGYQCTCRLGYELHSDERRCENACGGLIDSSNGTITSPSFPDIYPSNKNCIWEIIAPPQWRITINFTHFDIEGNNQDCEYDSLAVSSKMGSGEARQHGLFCGNRLPPVITSEGNSLRLEFLSDNSVQKNGFAAIFFTDKDECATENGGCQHVCRNTIGAYYCSCHQGFVLHENGHDCKEGGCKHEITVNKGEISSPHYPDYYPAKKECVWIFSTTAGHRIKLIFTEFELEPHQECAYDHIVVYDGHTTSQQILGRFCGSKLPHPLITTDSSMLLVFKSDASVQRKGFMAEHMTVCGGHLEADLEKHQIFSHAKHGDINYENKEDCDWIIEAPQGRHVHLRFNTFELEEEQDCGYDFIEVFSGYDDSGPSYGRFCGNQVPPEIISVDESLLLRFKSDDTINSKGFSATYVIIEEAENKEESIDY